jgi:AcrR family transcriptional regulator
VDVPTELPVVDGRTARRHRTRAGIVSAVAELIAEGDLMPTGPRIAERAGVSLRSINLHFEDRESLLVAVAEHVVAPLLAGTQRIDPSGDRATRIDAFVVQRAQLLEGLTNVSRASRVYETRSPSLQVWRRRLLGVGRAEVLSVFRVELGSREERDDVLVAALDAACGWSTWDWLRESGLDEKAAAAVMRRTVTALLEGAGRL